MIRFCKHLPFLRTLLLTVILVASGLGGGRALAEDTLILADGMKTGTLEGCSGGACSFDGAAVPRASIYFIGLEAATPPPQPQDYTRDEVHLRDGSVHPGPLVTIDADDVVTGTASHAREDVAWIWLTPLTPGEEEQGQAAPSTTTSDGDGDGEAEADKDRPIYLWEGTIRVESRYNDAKYGRHHWQAEYRVKFREIVWEDPYPSSGSGRSITNNELEPLDLAYAYRADQAWQVWPNDMKTITLHGQASGHSRGDGPTTGLVLRGAIWGLYEPWAEAHRGPSSFATYKEAGSYASDHWGAVPEPGWYHFLIEARGTEAERRALYAGIERGGTSPIYSDPDRDFLDYVPVCMPGPTWVTGRLDRPDQAEVQGGFSYLYPGGENVVGASDEVTVEWFFVRTRQ